MRPKANGPVSGPDVRQRRLVGMRVLTRPRHLIRMADSTPAVGPATARESCSRYRSGERIASSSLRDPEATGSVRWAGGYLSCVAVEWPDWREDVLIGLETLAAKPPQLEKRERDPRWPDLTNAVHWVVDDTFWDFRDPADHIGTVLVDEEEAAALRLVVAAVVAVSERQVNNDDRSWFSDEDWSRVQALAAHAAALMRRNPDAR
jgi:hypothetical protein